MTKFSTPPKNSMRRVSGRIYEPIREVLCRFVDDVLGDAIVIMQHGRRNTVRAEDVIQGLKRKGHCILGYGGGF